VSHGPWPSWRVPREDSAAAASSSIGADRPTVRAGFDYPLADTSLHRHHHINHRNNNNNDGGGVDDIDMPISRDTTHHDDGAQNRRCRCRLV